MYLYQRGYAMVTGLVLLAVLTLVAMMSSRTSIVETRMASGNVRHTLARECSETLRLGLARVFDTYVFQRDWPASAGGGIPDNQFGATPVAGMRVSAAPSSTQAEWRHFFKNVGPTDGAGQELSESNISPVVLREDVTLQDGGQKQGGLSIYRMRHAPSPGSGLGQNEGGSGNGFGAAQRGSLVYYDLRSTGGFQCAGSTRAVTNSDYRYVAR
jgi:hypothetical protein